MLGEIPWSKFLEWKAFESLEPFGEERADWNHAHIVQALMRNGKPLREFLLPIGDAHVETTPQPIEYQERLIDTWIAGSNAILAAKGVK